MWTVVLIGLLVLDSVFTVFIGVEKNPLILYLMEVMSIGLAGAMAVRIVYCLPLVYIVHRYRKAKTAVIAYLALYAVLSIEQIRWLA